MIVAVDETHDRGSGGCIRRFGQGGPNGAQEKRGAGFVAVVALVTHVQCLGNHAAQIDRPTLPQGALQRRIERAGHPVQAGQDVRAVGAVTQHFTQTLVLGCIGRGAIFNVFDDEHRH